MAPTTNRASLFTKTFRVLKKHYEPVEPPQEQTVFDAVLLACCLEDAPYDKANEAIARLGERYFDWNEVRVTTVSELTESMIGLPDPQRAASNLKHSLQSIFEAHYAFDLEALRKQNLGKAIKELQKYEGVSRFVVGYVVQSTLGGHSIPIDSGVLEVVYIIGAIDEKEKAKGKVPGMERAIPKSKGVLFGSLLHQMAADFSASPYSSRVRDILLQIADDAKDRLPKRVRAVKPTQKKGAEKADVKKAETKKTDVKKAPKATKAVAKTTKKKKAAKPAKKTTAPKKKVVKKKAAKRSSSRLSKRKPK